MPTLDFKGKRHIYAHHLTVPYRPLAVVFTGKYIELDNLSELNIMFGELPFEIRRSEQV